MGRTKLLLLLGGMAAIAVTVPIAQGTTAAKDPRVGGLIKKVNALQASVRSLQSDIGSLKSDVGALTSDVSALKQTVATLQGNMSCLQYKVLPVSQYGTASGEGYVYATDSGANLFLVTALDVTQSGQTPGAWVDVVNPSCVKSFDGRWGTMRPRKEPFSLLLP
jgi:outer membrane murein-binding lipoprotein Lpp